MPTATSAASQALPHGLRIRRERRWPAWLGVVAVVAAGVAAGLIVSGTPAAAALGTIAVLLAVGSAAYRLALGLAVLAFTYPFDLTTKLGPLKLTTSGLLMGILVATWLVAQTRAERPNWIHTCLDRPVLLFAGATALSILGFGGHLDDQLVGLAKAAGGFLMFFIATQSLRERRDIWMVVCAVVATALVQAVWLTLQVFSGSLVISEESRATGMVIDANLFAGYLVLVIPLTAAAGLAVRSRWAMLATALGVLALGVAMVATLSRSGWLGMMVSLIVLGVLVPNRRRELMIVVGAIVVVLLVGGISGPIADRLAPHVDGPIEMLVSRWYVWAAAVGVFVHHPLLGVGVANFQNYYLDYMSGDPGLNHAHNLFLNIAAERGAIGLLAFAYLLAVLVRALLRLLSRLQTATDRYLTVALIAALLGYLAHSLLEVSYYDYKILLLFWLLVGVVGSVSWIDARLDFASQLQGTSVPQDHD